MSAEKLDNTSFCHSCGAFLPSDSICSDCNQLVTTIKKPKTVLPNCASHINNEGELPPEYNPKLYNEIMSRECCRCGKCWECTFIQSIEGPCPNCGASGVFGVNEDFMNDPLSALSKLIDEIEETDKNPDKKIETIIKKMYNH